MRSQLKGELSGILFLILAIGASVFIGKEMLFAVVAIIFLLAQLGIYTLLLKNRGKVFWVFAVALVTEILFLVTKEFWIYALAILLLIAAGVWNVFLLVKCVRAGRFC